MRTLVLALSLAVAIALSACGAAGPTTSVPAASGGSGGEVRSNVRFADYAGTKACAPCHASHVATWLESPMHNMTRSIAGAEVKGPFDGRVFKLHEDTAKLETIDGERYITIDSKRNGSGKYKVTRVIGGHHREDYAGVLASGGGDEEMVLPVSFVYATNALRYKGYSVMVKERPGLKAGPVWGETCIFCHNTVPYLDTVLGALMGAGAPGYQGEVVDPLLPSAKRAKYKITSETALTTAIEDELARIGAKKTRPTFKEAIAATRRSFRANHLVEVGIGCESCHHGSAEHVRDPKVKPSFEPKSDGFTVELPNASRAEKLNRVCARCHQVLFSRYEHTWEGGSRKRSPGGSNINSGEARDMMLGHCASKLTCIDCHDPHAPDATASLRKLAAAQEDALCTRCHTNLATNDALQAHSHHDPAGAGARCLGCHMPKKNMSLDGTLSRYHRIGSPTDPSKVLLDRPLECALCHADAPVSKLVTTMEKWWKKSFERGALLNLYGDLDANVLLATIERGKPHEQAVAFQVLGDFKVRAAIPALAGQLTHPYPIVRGYAKRALDEIAGAPVPIDVDLEEAEIEKQTRAWLGSLPK